MTQRTRHWLKVVALLAIYAALIALAVCAAEVLDKSASW